jgi:septal ring factor EnvC (AmiA/AmiB activator)
VKRALLLFTVLVLGGSGAGAWQAGPFQDPDKTREALREALAEQRTAEARSSRLQAEAAQAANAADKTAREAAAVAAGIQQAEAGRAAALARISIVDGERATLRAQLGVEQEPLVRLTAALQQFSRRPLALSVLQPGSVKEMVYTRALLASAVPIVRARTAGLRSLLARSRQLRAEATQLAASLRDQTNNLTRRQQELAGIEARQQLASREAGGNAARESEHALALAEQARDLDSLVGALDRADQVGRRLAALSGPVLRPARPEDAELATAPPVAPGQTSAVGPSPAPYLLPVAGRTVAGFGAAEETGNSHGVTLAPQPGAEVVSPAAGRVVFAGPYRGYGRIVIIDHEGGWTSLITGLARLDIRVGDNLVGGSPLGVAGQGQPTISLELRRAGEPVNPLQYLR